MRIIKIYIGIQHLKEFLDGKKMKKQGPTLSTHYMINHTFISKADAEGMSYEFTI